MSETLSPGQVVGILGGGQLGRMLAMAAARLGLKAHVYEPGVNPPAGEVAGTVTTASYEDEKALRAFAEACDVVTYEFENVPAEALDLIESLVEIRPNRRALAVSQDRLTEKDFLSEIGLRPAPYANVTTDKEMAEAVESIGVPSILKTRRLGYDGKGQARLRSIDDAEAALVAMSGADAVLEGFVNFEREISVIAARGQDGRIACFEPGENVHKNGILHTTTLPATVSDAVRTEAIAIAEKILIALDYVGVLGVELFVTADGLVVNEIAPRVHNSGHWTEAGAVIDQFEQHIRAVAGWPMVNPVRHSDVVMENLIGDDMERVPEIAKEDGTRIHLYGKADVKSGRKMGHITRVSRKP